MNKQAVATELVKVAKALVGSPKQAAWADLKASDWAKIEMTLRTCRRMMEDAEAKMADLKQWPI